MLSSNWPQILWDMDHNVSPLVSTIKKSAKWTMRDLGWLKFNLICFLYVKWGLVIVPNLMCSSRNCCVNHMRTMCMKALRKMSSPSWYVNRTKYLQIRLLAQWPSVPLVLQATTAKLGLGCHLSVANINCTQPVARRAKKAITSISNFKSP